MILIKDDWLSNIFDYDVFKLDTSNDSICKLPETKSFIWTKVPTQNVELVSVLSHLNFQVVDVNVTFEISKKSVKNESSNDFHISEFSTNEVEQILKIAESSFTYSRFHLDPNIPNSVADRIKKLWIKNYTDGKRGVRLLVIRFENNVAGFLAELTANQNNKKVGIIDLISIDKNFQGKGLGKALVKFWITDCMGKYDVLKVGTQVANIPSIRLYQQCGFELSESLYILHRHIK